MNRFTLILTSLLFLIFFVEKPNKAFGQEKDGIRSSECNPPKDVSAVCTHAPDWYNVKVSWGIPERTDRKGMQVFNNGPIVTHQGEGFDGSDVSAIEEGFGFMGYYGNKELGISLADDFTLDAACYIDSIHFYTIQEVVSEPAPQANVKELYVRIYDGPPNEGGKVIWGDFTTNCRGGVVFPKIYRAPADFLTYNVNPIMRTTAVINTSLQAGVYWLEVTATSVVNAGAPQYGRIIFPPVTILGQSDSGNALICTDKGWEAMKDVNNNAHGGLPMDIYGTSSSSRYNVYRDNVKLTIVPVSELSYVDLVPEAGEYVYGVTTVVGNCESEQATTTLEVEQNPCEMPFVVPQIYREGFESDMPFCWREEADGENKSWEFVAADVSQPGTASQGVFKAIFREAGTTRLITKMLDISAMNEPELYFWHAQKALEGHQDELRVFYKSSETAEWTQILEYTTEIADWKRSSIELPDASGTYWLAFEAQGNGGYGVMLDDILIKEAQGIGCTAPKNLETTIHDGNWYNVNLTWEAPEGAIQGNNTIMYNNGPIVTHPGAGYNGADVSAIELNAQSGMTCDQIAGYTIADDFTLDKPTYIHQIAFYMYEPNAEYFNPDYIEMLFLRIFDGSPKDGGKVIWGDTYTERINKDATAFSNIFRVLIEDMESPLRPVFRVVGDVNITLPAGTYWIEAIPCSLIPPYEGGVVYAVPVTRLDEQNTGNALQRTSEGWIDVVDPNKGPCALPFEVIGKPLPLTYEIYRDGEKIDDGIVPPNYIDLAPDAGSYNYCVKAIWDDGCVSNEICTKVVMPKDPCDTPVSEFPYTEGFEQQSDTPLNYGCWSQEVVKLLDDGYQEYWFVVPDFVSKPDNTHSGEGKAYFNAVNGVATKLISPKFDLTSLEKPALSFWHTQRKMLDGFNELHLYYKNAPDAEWVLLVKYQTDIPDWTEETIPLPNPTASYWIAFEAVTRENGYAILLDDVSVGEREEYSITASAEGEGSITPTGKVTVLKGADQTFAMAPTEGYEVEEVLIDGVSIGQCETYTFEKINADHAIHAKFKIKVGITDNDKPMLTAFPNPTDGQLKISNMEKNIKKIQVFDIMGQLLQEIDNINATEAILNFSHFTNGIYLVNIDGRTLRIVKQ